jgi:hypothetical protein
MMETAQAFREEPKQTDAGPEADKRSSRLARWIPVILFLTNLFLVYAFFLPNLRDINLWDEASIVASGQALIQGHVPGYASNPLVAILYAITYLPFNSSPFWMVQSTSLGRLILFSLLWLGTYLVARRLSRWAAPLVMLGMLFVTPMSVEFLRFPSDPLFASMAAISFSFVLAYLQDGRARNALWASLFLGLAALARNDGLILFFVFVPLIVLVCAPLRQWKVSLAAAIGPFVVLVGGAVLVAGLFTGSFDLGTMARTYDNFESGQQVVFGGTGQSNSVVQARLEARRLFGTPEENGYSVFRAIRRNPGAYLIRLRAILRTLPDTILHAYGIRFAAILLLLAARGILELILHRQWRLLAILGLWPAHLVSGFVITIFREGHVLLPFYIVFALAANGIASALGRLSRPSERVGWTVVLGALALYCLLANKLAVFYGVGVLLLALWLCVVALTSLRTSATALAVCLLILLAGGLILRGGFPSPSMRVLGTAADEQAVLYLRDHLPLGSAVAAGAPGAVIEADMSPATLSAADVPTGRSPEAMVDWLRSQGIRAVYVDQTLWGDNPALWALLQQQIGKGLERVFAGDGGDIQVLLVKPLP